MAGSPDNGAMRVDVSTLGQFYASPLGEVARRMAGRRLEALWPDLSGRDLLGLGYPAPYLKSFCASARRAIAFMPGPQGAERWPVQGASLSVCGDENRLPFMDSCFDRVLLVHALEEAADPRLLLREVWRVTAPEGRLAVLVANRAGLWSRADATPFGHGRPYSRGQLAQLLSSAMFEPTASARALYAPPSAWQPLVGVADAFERAGETIWPAFGGMLLMEAVKRLVITPNAPAQAARAAPRVVARPASGLVETPEVRFSVCTATELSP